MSTQEKLNQQIMRRIRAVLSTEQQELFLLFFFLCDRPLTQGGDSGTDRLAETSLLHALRSSGSWDTPYITFAGNSGAI